MFYIILVLSFICDFLSKYFVQKHLSEPIQLLWDFVYFEKYINHGIAFSLPLHWLLLKVITIVLVGAISYYYFFREERTHSNNIWYWFLIWWALWNAYERIFIWWVTDFIWVKYFSVFNLADSFIFLWILVLIIKSYAKWHIAAK